MGKNHNFVASDILTPELMNGLTQDSQIVSESSKGEDSDAIATTKWVRSASGDTALNAATATKLKNARSLKISDADGSNVAAAITFDGSGDATLKLPAKIKGNLEGTASHAVNADHATSASNAEEAEHSVSADTAVTQATSDNSNKIATTKFVKQAAYNADNPPPNPFEDWRRVTFAWIKNNSLSKSCIIATAETICHKSKINWSYNNDDIALSEIGIGGYDSKVITHETFGIFLKNLGYGGRGTNVSIIQKKLFPMYGITTLLSSNSQIEPSDVVLGAYVDRGTDKTCYVPSLHYIISTPNEPTFTPNLLDAEIHATVRRIM